MRTTGYDFKIGAPVLTAEGEVGRLKYVVVDPGAEVVTHLVVERGRLLRHDIVVPAGWVEHADAQRIHLNAKMADLEGLPEFREVEFWAPDPTAWSTPSGMAFPNAPSSWSAAPRYAPETKW
jgi:hypothetical protein